VNKTARLNRLNGVMGSESRAEVRMARAAGESSQWPEREEACQEALLTAWSAWPRLRDAARFEAWFDRILVNTCMELLRRRARNSQARLSDDSGLVDRDTAAGSAEQDAMARALGRLSPEHRATVVLRFWADLPTDGIAERLGVPPGTVRSRLHYALDALRADLGRDVTDE
jgi:RNA polymerase sigma-70 factor (ECF subfamily)